MNDPSKRIEVEKSSLLSLKVEVLKKQEEIRKRKEESVPEFRKIGNKQKLSAVIKNNEEKKVEKAKVYEVEDSKEFERSKKMLEAKSKYYEKMSKGSGKEDPACLVLFSKKKQDKDDLVEFTDCFGRSRHVPKYELEKLQQENDDISEVAEERLANEAAPATSLKILDTPSQASQEFFQKQKDDWRKTEEINKDREEIFYSNVLFDEARTHGVSYYTFSKDAEERKGQQDKLLKMRENTEDSQQKRMAMKTKRDEIIASRVRLAKKRRLEKLGLPYEEEEEKVTVSQMQDPELNKDSELKNVEKDPEEELRREMERRSHIRPWDKDKTTSKSHYKDHFEKSDDDWRPERERVLMTQDEWVDKQRTVRNSDFAPKYSEDEPKSSYKKYSTTSYKSMEDSITAGLKFMKKKFGANE